jgi:hypothetical protein
VAVRFGGAASFFGVCTTGLGFGLACAFAVVLGAAGGGGVVRVTAGRVDTRWTGAVAAGTCRTGAGGGVGAVRAAAAGAVVATGGSGVGVVALDRVAVAAADVGRAAFGVVAAGLAFVLRVAWVDGGSSGLGRGAPVAVSPASAETSAARTAHAVIAAIECRCRRDDVLRDIRPLPSSSCTVRRVASPVNGRGHGWSPVSRRPPDLPVHFRVFFFFIPPWSARVIAPPR